MKRSTPISAGVAALLLITATLGARADHLGAGVSINGQRLSPVQLQALESRLGTRIAPGDYLVDGQSGCWANLSTGQQGCLGGISGSYGSRYGSGEWNGSGDWSHWSDLSGGSVGGSGDGCVYAFGWSNC